MFQIWSLLPLFSTLQNTVISAVQCEKIIAEIVTVGDSLPRPESFSSLSIQGPASDMAVEEVRQRYTEITFIQTHINFFESCLTAGDSLEYRLSSWFYERSFIPNVTVILFPGMCGWEPRRLNLWAKNRNVLLITTVGWDSTVRDRIFSPTYICLTLATTNIPTFYAQLLSRYNWTTVFVLSEAKSLPAYVGHVDQISRGAKAAGAQLTARTYDAPNNGSEFEDILKVFSRLSRVMFFFGQARFLRQLVIKASQLNMTNGEYVYLTLDYLPLPNLYGRFTPLYNDALDEVARQAFRSVLIIQQYNSEHLTPSKLQLHLPDFQRRSLEDYNATVPQKFAGYFCLTTSYASVLLFAQVIEEVRLVGDYGELSNGAALAQRFLGRGFNTSIGRFEIDKYGRNQINLTVTFVDYNTSNRKTFLKLDSTDGSVLQEVSPMPWLLGHAPLNKPLCGYMGDECADRSFGKDQLTGAVAGVSFLLIGVMWFLRNRIRSLDRHALRWCWLNHEDLQFFHPKTVLDGFSNSFSLSNIFLHMQDSLDNLLLKPQGSTLILQSATL